MQAMLMIPGGLFDERCEWLTITDWLTDCDVPDPNDDVWQ